MAFATIFLERNLFAIDGDTLIMYHVNESQLVNSFAIQFNFLMKQRS